VGANLGKGPTPGETPAIRRSTRSSSNRANVYGNAPETEKAISEEIASCMREQAYSA